ncbi:MAG: FKBP-type peptidyl-prolyl cis-trans isomerase [Bacteroidota bacterium]
MKYLKLPLFLIGIALFSACSEGDSFDPAKQLAEDLVIIDQYLADNNLTATETPSGLHYIIEEEGNGEFPNADHPVIFAYQGYFTNNNLWAESFYGPEVFWLFSLPLGLEEGIPFFQVGGKGKLILPSELAFGREGNTNVPPNTVMVFDIQLPELCMADTTFPGKQSCLDEIKINQYLTENSLMADSSTTGLRYIIEDEGIGNAKPTLADEVTVDYKGYLLDGTVFDEPADPVEFQLSGVIAGWREGIQLFKKGGKGMLFIPSSLGYGTQPPTGSNIPPNAALVFEIELIDF